MKYAPLLFLALLCSCNSPTQTPQSTSNGSIIGTYVAMGERGGDTVEVYRVKVDSGASGYTGSLTVGGLAAYPIVPTPMGTGDTLAFASAYMSDFPKYQEISFIFYGYGDSLSSSRRVQAPEVYEIYNFRKL